MAAVRVCGALAPTVPARRPPTPPLGMFITCDPARPRARRLYRAAAAVLPDAPAEPTFWRMRPVSASPAELPAAGPIDGEVSAELKRIARHHLRARAPGPTIATIATSDPVHEGCLKFGAADAADWNSRAHCFGAASRAMRQVLVNYARNRGAAKRGGGMRAVTLTGADAEIAACLGITPRTVRRDWLKARLFLARELGHH